MNVADRDILKTSNCCFFIASPAALLIMVPGLLVIFETGWLVNIPHLARKEAKLVLNE